MYMSEVDSFYESIISICWQNQIRRILIKLGVIGKSDATSPVSIYQQTPSVHTRTYSREQHSLERQVRANPLRSLAVTAAVPHLADYNKQ